MTNRSTSKLQDDPLQMPPPYWRSSGAVFHLIEAVQDLEKLLQQLLPVHNATENELEKYYENHPEHVDDDEEAMEEFSEIVDELWGIEHRIKLKAELACLMSAILAEDELNEFCVFNLHQDIAESIERLSPAEKLLVASAAVGKTDVKGSIVFEGMRKLVSWRNAFAHGHCTDRPLKSLRHNHLVHPEEYPGVPSALREATDLTSSLMLVTDHLRRISKNPYTAGKSGDIEEIRQSLERLKTFVISGNNTVYSIVHESV